MNSLIQDVIQYRQHSFAQNTKSTYRTHRRTYLEFCRKLNVPIAPLNTDLLCMYAAYLARFLKPTSVCQYLNFVGLLHKEFSLPNPLLDNWVLSTVLGGIKRLHGSPPRPKLPVTTDMLLAMRQCLNLSNSYHASFWAICLTAFFGLFRKSHLLPDSGCAFDLTKQFTRGDFSLSSFGFIVHVRWSKTIQLGQRTLFIPLIRISQSVLCPVAAISQAFALVPGASLGHQAFCFLGSDSRICVFTYKAFMKLFKSLLARIGCRPREFGSHSFRRGGASFALQSGVPLDVISIMGDWRSDAMFCYLHMPFSQRLAAQQVLAASLK